MHASKGCKAARLAAAVALALGSTAVMAGAPSANQLPGYGTVVVGTATATTPDSETLNIALGGTSAVINWGSSGGTINAAGTGGFNIGSAAAVNFTGATGVLNIDSSGTASQIFGTLTAASNVFVANANGVIVGAGATVSSSGELGLVGNALTGTNGGFTGASASLGYNGNGGDVTVQSGASLSGSIVLVAGGRNVNVDLGALTSGAVSLAAGGAANGGSGANTSAALAVTGSKGSATIAAFSSAGTASNAGTLDLSGITWQTGGLFTNNGNLTLQAAGNGAVASAGQLNTPAGASFKSLRNTGAYAAANGIAVSGGDLVNSGSITNAGIVTVTDGNLVNSGSMSGVVSLATLTDAQAVANADYSITNASAGSVTMVGSPTINANSVPYGGFMANTTGSFRNAGSLGLADNTSKLTIKTQGNLDLGGALNVAGQTNSATLAQMFIGGSFTAGGTMTISTPLFLYDPSSLLLTGRQIKFMANITGISQTGGGPAAGLQVAAGAQMANDYAIRVASGKTIAVGLAIFSGNAAGNNPNVILQGTVSAPIMTMGAGIPVSDLVTGPSGGLVIPGITPKLTIWFSGRVKTAPYLNDPNNFRYNYLPITATGGALNFNLNPYSYTTNGTTNGLSAVNILVNGSFNLTGPATPVQATARSATTGPSNWENTHLVLQATGNIATTGAFYWPGYVYLGTIASNSGAPAPSTLGSGTITLGGNFNNVVPGRVDNGGGVHFISQNALAMGAFNVITNANSWVNFGTQTLTQNYANGTLGTQQFFGGVAAGGDVVNYNQYLDPGSFHFHPPVAAR